LIFVIFIFRLQSEKKSISRLIKENFMLFEKTCKTCTLHCSVAFKKKHCKENNDS